MKWVTRRSIRVNRLATAWLIRRFIDPQAVFLFVEPDEVVEIRQREGAKGFDALGATTRTKTTKAGVRLRPWWRSIVPETRCCGRSPGLCAEQTPRKKFLSRRSPQECASSLTVSRSSHKTIMRR